MTRTSALLSLFCLAACATPVTVVVHTVPPTYDIAPAKRVAVIGRSEQDPPDEAEDEFLDLLITKLRKRGQYEVLDERQLARDINPGHGLFEAEDLQKYLNETAGDVVVRVRSPTDNCRMETKVIEENDPDDDEDDTVDWTADCAASLALIKARTGESLGRLEAFGHGDDRDQWTAWNDGMNDAAAQIIDAFAPQPGAVDPAVEEAQTAEAVKARAAHVADTAINISGTSYLLIPAGTFPMGCTKRDLDCEANESPVHPVTISKPFYMAFTPTTNAEYRRCVEAGACHGKAEADPQKRLNPVVDVTWNEARDFCAWAGGRLPTEAEWEYAARGGTEVWRFPWRNIAGKGNANFADNGGRKLEALGIVRTSAAVTYPFNGTTPVGMFGRNGFGLADVTGNVSQWTADWKGDYPSGAVTDPTGPATGLQHVLRGGSWAVTGMGGRISVRYAAAPDFSQDTVGFRCALDRSPTLTPTGTASPQR